MFNRIIAFFKDKPLQTYVNGLLVSIGLLADIISLFLFFSAINTPVEGSNFYINSNEYLSWILVALVYSIGLLNAYWRRRWRKLYGDSKADHSIIRNLSAFFDLEVILGGKEDDEKQKIRKQNFKRDFSLLYAVMFPITFLFNRAITASENATGITESPWGDLLYTAFISVFVAIGMMMVTSIFDYTMSMFIGDQKPMEEATA